MAKYKAIIQRYQYGAGITIEITDGTGENGAFTEDELRLMDEIYEDFAETYPLAKKEEKKPEKRERSPEEIKAIRAKMAQKRRRA